MGLAFSHGDSEWSYSSFMDFRIKLAAEIGVSLPCMEGFAQDILYKNQYDKLVVYGLTDNKNKSLVNYCPVIKWSTVNDDIKTLLIHSDCNGALTIDECKSIAPRLRGLVANWEPQDFHTLNALDLAAGMEEAINNNEIFEFL